MKSRGGKTEEVVIARDNMPLVKLVRVGDRKLAPGSAKGLLRISADFEDPLADFDEYRD